MAGSKNTTASAPSAPFLVAPSDSTSTPHFQVASAGVHRKCARALAKRAPSMCTGSSCCRAAWLMAAISSSPIDRAPFGGLGQSDGTGLHVMHPELFRVGHGFCQLFGANLAIGGGKTDQLRAAAEKSRRAGLIGDDVRGLEAINRTVGGNDLRQRQRVGGGAAGHREYCDLLFKDIARDGLQLCRQLIAAVRRWRSPVLA